MNPGKIIFSIKLVRSYQATGGSEGSYLGGLLKVLATPGVLSIIRKVSKQSTPARERSYVGIIHLTIGLHGARNTHLNLLASISMESSVWTAPRLMLLRPCQRSLRK